MVLLALLSLAHADDWKLTGTGKAKASVVFASSSWTEVGTATGMKHIYKIKCAKISGKPTCEFIDQSTTSPSPTYTTTAVLTNNENFTVTVHKADGFCDDYTYEF